MTTTSPRTIDFAEFIEGLRKAPTKALDCVLFGQVFCNESRTTILDSITVINTWVVQGDRFNDFENMFDNAMAGWISHHWDKGLPVLAGSEDVWRASWKYVCGFIAHNQQFTKSRKVLLEKYDEDNNFLRSLIDGLQCDPEYLVLQIKENQNSGLYLTWSEVAGLYGDRPYYHGPLALRIYASRIEHRSIDNQIELMSSMLLKFAAGLSRLCQKGFMPEESAEDEFHSIASYLTSKIGNRTLWQETFSNALKTCNNRRVECWVKGLIIPT